MSKGRYLVILLISLFFLGIGSYLFLLGYFFPKTPNARSILSMVFGGLTALSALFLLTLRRIARTVMLATAIINALWWQVVRTLGTFGTILTVITARIRQENIMASDLESYPLFILFIIFGFLCLLSLIFLLHPETKRLFK